MCVQMKKEYVAENASAETLIGQGWRANMLTIYKYLQYKNV